MDNEHLFSEIRNLGEKIDRFRKIMEKEYHCKSKYELSISKRLESNILWVQLECMQDLMEVLIARARLAKITIPSKEQMEWHEKK